MWYMYARNIIAFTAMWMKLETIILNDISQTKKDKYLEGYLCAKSKKIIQNELIYNTETYS